MLRRPCLDVCDTRITSTPFLRRFLHSTTPLQSPSWSCPAAERVLLCFHHFPHVPCILHSADYPLHRYDTITPTPTCHARSGWQGQICVRTRPNIPQIIDMRAVSKGSNHASPPTLECVQPPAGESPRRVRNASRVTCNSVIVGCCLVEMRLTPTQV